MAQKVRSPDLPEYHSSVSRSQIRQLTLIVTPGLGSWDAFLVSKAVCIHTLYTQKPHIQMNKNKVYPNLII